MRVFVTVACALFAASTLLAEEPAKDDVTKPDASAPQAKETPGEEKKEEVAEEKKEVPVHEHPTILRMLALNNQIRARRGLAPHSLSIELTNAAQDHAVYMASRHNFDHYSNGGPSGRARRWGYSTSVRENIARGQGNVDQAFNTWVGSGAHYASIVSGTSEAGFGMAVARNGTPYYVGVYGYGRPRVEVLKPANSAPAATPVPASSAPPAEKAK
jgi:uncharacterized protein YkwD